MSKTEDDLIRKYALQNAFRYGKADPGKIIGKVLGEKPELKEKAKEVMVRIRDVVGSVNSMQKEEIEKELKSLAPELTEKKREEKKGLPELKNAGDDQGKGPCVVMRFEPSPSGPLHLGHSYVLALNSEYCRKYSGKLVLRIADTNPGNIDPVSYTRIPEDAGWLTDGNISEVVVQSDRMDSYYSRALEMIEQGHAYVCTCTAEGFREFSNNRQECPCRKNTPEHNVKLWHKMFDGFAEGEAVLRMKTDMKHKNPAMRDFPLMRINDEEHPRQGKKYRVWPLMNFSVAVDDHDMAMTHIIRAKDHADNAKRQEFIQHAMGWNVPQTQFVGRINFIDLELSSSKTRKRIDEGEFTGWDDIRLPFLMALRRRGYQPGAFVKYALDVGVSLSDKKVSNDEFFKALNAFNKEIIDPSAMRYFFVEDPVEVRIEGAPEQRIELDMHPDNREGGRIFNTKDRFYIARQDLESIKEGELVRLMDCLNFRMEGQGDDARLVFDSPDYERYRKEGRRIIHWLPAERKDDLFETAVAMPDGSVREGLGEQWMKGIKEGDIVQLERFGFCRLDEEQGNKLKFWFAHK
ncbi:MAG: glutamate--tRNA ligase [Candidatus Woesearchaeota archaeon]